MACHYLDIPDLLEISVKMIASEIEGKKSENSNLCAKCMSSRVYL